MNNSQFRKLVLDTPARKASNSSPANPTSQNGVAATPSALGSRMRSSIPMTPRSIAGASSKSYSSDFARQLAERSNPSSSSTKKFRSSAAPKGAKLADGYTDRARSRLSENEGKESDKVERVKALEEMMKLDQIDEATFRKLRDEILGDDVGAERASLVKGLDWALLERVKRGEVGVEDVLEGGTRKENTDEAEEDDEEDVDDAFDELENQSVEAVVKEKAKKKGEMAPPALTGKKRNRDEILADMKAAREAAKGAAQPSLGSKFKKLGDKRSDSRIERDGKGREVLITVDENGIEKRKVRKVQIQEEPVLGKGHGLLMPDIDVAPLGMEVPEIPKVDEPEEDIDIFDDVGDDYDPLAGLGDSESESEAEGEDGEISAPKNEKSGSMAPPPRPKATGPRNYFGDSTPVVEDSSKPKALSDPTILAALKKASSLNPIEREAKSTEEAAKEARRTKMLQQDDRDAQDMDMGFGSSRFEDEEDFEEKKIELSEWNGKGGDDDENEEGGGKGKAKRKRGPKKRKGDKDNAADVLKVMERQKAAK